jgi:hypothetical protein
MKIKLAKYQSHVSSKNNIGTKDFKFFDTLKEAKQWGLKAMRRYEGNLVINKLIKDTEEYEPIFIKGYK